VRCAAGGFGGYEVWDAGTVSMQMIKAFDKEGVLVAYITESKLLDENKIAQIGQDLLEAVDQAAEKKLLLNFRGVSFMSSAMIGKLVLLNRKCREQQVQLKLCNIDPNIAEVFKIMQLNKVFDIQKDEEKAIKAFSKKGWFG
jgi:anti-anti-sigma factor